MLQNPLPTPEAMIYRTARVMGGPAGTASRWFVRITRRMVQFAKAMVWQDAMSATQWVVRRTAPGGLRFAMTSGRFRPAPGLGCLPRPTARDKSVADEDNE
jgi:hypothetical protein